MVDSVHYSSATDEWSTPKDLFDKLNAVFNFTLDAAASDENALCPVYFTQSDDGLSQCWSGHTVWLNSPYSNVGEWVAKAHKESKHSTIVMLLPARTDTRYWHNYIFPFAREIYYIKGRLKFGDAKNSAPFPSALIVFGPSVKNAMENK